MYSHINMFGIQKCSRILKRNDLETVRRHNEFSAGAILTSVAICFAQNWKKVNFKVCDSSKHYTCVYASIPVKREKSFHVIKNVHSEREHKQAIMRSSTFIIFSLTIQTNDSFGVRSYEAKISPRDYLQTTNENNNMVSWWWLKVISSILHDLLEVIVKIYLSGIVLECRDMREELIPNLFTWP
uniref:Uncharacterized protein n=1 Tax=Glossina brevipalpis TaxID=37001 RepID=A0A1A9W7I5_9MUSC